jgi:CHAT domain
VKPWRILENGKIQEDTFLCERYAVSRWLRGTSYFIESKNVNKISLVVPSDTPFYESINERDWIKAFGKKFGLETTVNSKFEEVTSALMTGGFDILHFSTHGQYRADDPILSSIVLENKTELKPVDIVGLCATFGQSKPLVFMNTCHSSTQGFSASGIQGWAKRFLEAGVCAFIGTIWSVSDDTAFKFSQGLYLQLANGSPLGDAVQKARLKCKESGDLSWLSYQVYGHPNMQFRLPVEVDTT